MNSLKPAWQWLALLALSIPVSAVLAWAGFPSAFLLGPMLSGIAFGLGGSRLRVPRWGFTLSQAAIGCLVARAITPALLVSLIDDWLVMVLVVAASVLAGGFVGWVLVRFGSLPGTTAAWGSSPGGAGAMIAMAAENGADFRLVAFMQYFRVVLVVVSASLVSRILIGDSGHPVATAAAGASWLAPVPLLPFAETMALCGIGAMVGSRIGIPAGGMLVPMMVGATLHATGLMDIILPIWLLAVCYFVLGWYVGLGFNRDTLAYVMRAIPQVLASSCMLIALCGVSAWVLTWLLGTDALTAYLATTPGGLDSVTIIAVGSGADTPFVMALQTLRLFTVIFAGPPLAKFLSRFA